MFVRRTSSSHTANTSGGGRFRCRSCSVAASATASPAAALGGTNCRVLRVKRPRAEVVLLQELLMRAHALHVLRLPFGVITLVAASSTSADVVRPGAVVTAASADHTGYHAAGQRGVVPEFGVVEVAAVHACQVEVVVTTVLALRRPATHLRQGQRGGCRGCRGGSGAGGGFVLTASSRMAVSVPPLVLRLVRVVVFAVVSSATKEKKMLSQYNVLWSYCYWKTN